MEYKVPVLTQIVYKVCDSCKEGFMQRSNDAMLTSDPPSYKHKCNKCGVCHIYLKSYPSTQYVITEPMTTDGTPVLPQDFIYKP